MLLCFSFYLNEDFCVIDYFVKQDVRSLNRLKLYIGNSTCLNTKQTVHNIHKLLLFDINASDVLLI